MRLFLYEFRKKIFSAIWLAVCAQIIGSPVPASGQAEIPVISGTVARPLPAILPLDYPASLTSAWLLALRNAEIFLPQAAIAKLDETGLTSANAKLALCALLFPVDVATPEYSAGAEIRVFLSYPQNMAETLQNIIRQPARLIFVMVLIEELRTLLQEMGAVWPDNLQPDSIDLDQLETLSRKISGLWTAINPDFTSQLEKNVSLLPDSAVMATLQASQKLKEGHWQDSIALAAKAKDNADRQSEKMDPKIMNALKAIILNIRGQAHLRAGQTALAEFDFSEALKLLDSGNFFSNLRMEILQGRAAIKNEKRDWPGMCEDLDTICQLGDCHGLFEARLRGFCQSRENEPASAN